MKIKNCSILKEILNHDSSQEDIIHGVLRLKDQRYDGKEACVKIDKSSAQGTKRIQVSVDGKNIMVLPSSFEVNLAIHKDCYFSNKIYYESFNSVNSRVDYQTFIEYLRREINNIIREISLYIYHGISTFELLGDYQYTMLSKILNFEFPSISSVHPNYITVDENNLDKRFRNNCECCIKKDLEDIDNLSTLLDVVDIVMSGSTKFHIVN